LIKDTYYIKDIYLKVKRISVNNTIYFKLRFKRNKRHISDEGRVTNDERRVAMRR